MIKTFLKNSKVLLEIMIIICYPLITITKDYPSFGLINKKPLPVLLLDQPGFLQ